jgi:antibiotic biosynthesis monooxygenase (ABM) superfamily enzyme
MNAEPGRPAEATGPVTTTLTRRVNPGHEPRYEQFLDGIVAAASRFPGHRGAEVFRFPDPMSQAMAVGWRAGVAKAFERQNAALAQAPLAEAEGVRS